MGKQHDDDAKLVWNGHWRKTMKILNSRSIRLSSTGVPPVFFPTLAWMRRELRVFLKQDLLESGLTLRKLHF